MNVLKAQKSLIYISLAESGLVFIFLTLAPAFGFHLSWAQSLRIIELIVPVFFGYLGSAAAFVFQSRSNEHVVVAHPELVRILVFGPLILFFLGSVSLFIAFGVTNRSGAPPGIGMDIDTLAAGFTALLGLLTVTTHVAVSYLFSAGRK